MYLILVVLVVLISIILLIPIAIVLGKLGFSEGVTLLLFFAIGYLLVPATLMILFSFLKDRLSNIGREPHFTQKVKLDYTSESAQIIKSTRHEFRVVRCIQILGTSKWPRLFFETIDKKIVGLAGDRLCSFLSASNFPCENIVVYFDEELLFVTQVDAYGDQVEFSAVSIKGVKECNSMVEFEIIDSTMEDFFANID